MSGMAIKIESGESPVSSKANATGSIQHIITDEKRFGILDGNLKRKIGTHMGREPTDVYVRSPAPSFDTVKIDLSDWNQVHTVLIPIETKILSVDTVPTILSKMDFKNEGSKKGTFTGKLSEQVSTTVGTSWSQSYTLSFNQTIKYEVGFLGTGGGGSTSFGFQGQWGKRKEPNGITNDDHWNGSRRHRGNGAG